MYKDARRFPKSCKFGRRTRKSAAKPGPILVGSASGGRRPAEPLSRARRPASSMMSSSRAARREAAYHSPGADGQCQGLCCGGGPSWQPSAVSQPTAAAGLIAPAVRCLFRCALLAGGATRPLMRAQVAHRPQAQRTSPARLCRITTPARICAICR